MRGGLAVALVAMATAAHADAPAPRARARLRAAEALVAGLDLEAALTEARAGLREGDGRPADTWRLHAVVGEAAAAMGDAATAQAAFARALSLRPSYEIDSTASPRLREPFLAARAQVGRAALVALPEARFVAPDRVRISVRVEGDVAALVAGARLYALAPGAAAREMARGAAFVADVPCPQGTSCPYYAALVDAEGNELVWAGSPSAPLPVEHPTEPRPAPRGPGLSRAWPALASAGAFAAAGAFFGIRAADAQASLEQANANRARYTLAEAQSFDEARRRDGALMWGSLAALGISLGIAYVLW